ncbi:DUF4159 domain-containing protein [Poriferisphaera sp. WC338]|uniref:DUF4159 domain-containing protein n=1 Tax=Poriferisphaera sp. WC338 TaxID=3425129 RepID=UPI003D81A891
MRRISICLWVCVLAWAGSAQGATDEQIQQAITRMQDYFFSIHDGVDQWENQYKGNKIHGGGETALVTYALLSSGISPQDARLSPAIQYLMRKEMNGTYARSLRAHCFAAMPSSYASRLLSDARWLKGAQSKGRFDYGAKFVSRFDHSVTQYGVLGLWEYAKRGGGAAPLFWKSTQDHFISCQNEDGGWGYTPGQKSTDAMTAAGVTALLVAQEQIHRNRSEPSKQLQEAIERGLVWLDLRAHSKKGLVGGGAMYDLYSIERVGMASGLKTFGRRDWFDAGADHILKRENGTGSLGQNRVDTAFALLFLARGRVAVWMNKLRLSGREWNNRPNDLHMLTRHISKVREKEQNWQVVNADSPAHEWLNAPAAWLSSNREIEMTPREKKNLKRYISLGGLLVVCPEKRSKRFEVSITAMLSEMFPRAKWQEMSDDHPALTLLYEIDLPESRKGKVLSNGVRDLAIVLPDDWGMVMQRDKQATKKYDARDAMLNLYASVTDHGRQMNRMATLLEGKKAGVARDEMLIVRARYDGQWWHEPNSFHAVANMVFNRAEVELLGANLSIREIDVKREPMVRLTGKDAATLKDDELGAIEDYVLSGGTVLVETIGGRGRFSIELMKQLSLYLGREVRPVDDDSPLVNGAGLVGGFDRRKCGYRQFTILQVGPQQSARLSAIYLGNRPAIIFSHEDLTLAEMGVLHWGISGYDVQTSRELLYNIIMYVHQMKREGEPRLAGEKRVSPMIPAGIAEVLIHP